MHAVARTGPRRWGLLLVLPALLALSGAVLAGLSEVAAESARWVGQSARNPQPSSTPAPGIVGRPAPELSLPSLRSEQRTITLSEYRGKVVYLDFWSAWCAPCRRTMPALDRLRDEYAGAGFEVLGVNLDPEVADGRRLLDALPLGYPMAVDTAALSAARFGVTTLPALVVVDRAGVVREVRQGEPAAAMDDLRRRLAGLIEERDIR